MNTEPYVNMRPSKNDGLYNLGKTPAFKVPHNAASSEILKAIFPSRPIAHYRDLAVAVRGHRNYGRAAGQPQRYIDYCIRLKGLERAN